MNKLFAFTFMLLSLLANNAQAWGLGDMLSNAAQKAIAPVLQGDTDGAVKAATGSVLNDVNSNAAQAARQNGQGFAAGAMDTINAAEQAALNGGSSSGAVSPIQTGTAGASAKGVAASGMSSTAIAQACKTAGNSPSAKPYGTPQVDSFCQMATFDACLAASGIHDYDAEKNSVCSTIRGMGAKVSMCRACM